MLFYPQKHVLRDGQVVGNTQLLGNQADAGLLRLRRLCPLDLATLQLERSRVRRVQARQDFHERGFSSAVFPDQRVDLPGGEGESDVFEDELPPKLLLMP